MFKIERTVFDKNLSCGFRSDVIYQCESITDAVNIVHDLFMNKMVDCDNKVIRVNNMWNIMRPRFNVANCDYSFKAPNSVDFELISAKLSEDGEFAEIVFREKQSNPSDTISVAIEIVRCLNHDLDLKTIQVSLEPNAIVPERAHYQDAGLDLFTPVDFIAFPEQRTVVDTGVHVNIPDGYVGKLESKSGLMRKSGITCEGTIDAGYQGTLQAVIFNHSHEAVSFSAGDKITQLVIYPIATPSVEVVPSFNSHSERGNGGFGSTGK